jgi:hypothetical protein
MDPVSLRAAIVAAFDADAAGTASDSQRLLVEATTGAVADRTCSAPLMEAIKATIGPLSEVSSRSYAELNDIQKWIRSQQHESDRSRENPALRDMHSVYELLVSSASHAGAAIRLAPGANIIALDEQRRRFLVPAIKKEMLTGIRHAKSDAEARKLSRRKGAVQYHWSVERTGLVPSPEEALDLLPLPDDGAYMIMYAAPVAVVGKPAFVKAVERFAEALPLLDVLIWDASATPPTLWSLRGGFGHSSGDDVDWADEFQADAKRLQTALNS